MLILRLKPLDTMYENRQKFISFLKGLAAILVLKSDLVKSADFQKQNGIFGPTLFFIYTG